MLGATCRHRHLPACSAAVPLHCDLGATMRRPRLALGAAVALLMVFGASCVTTSKQQTSACEVAGYQYRRAQLPISSSDTFVVALGPPADIRRSPLELSAACEADPSCVMFTTTGFLLTVDWGTGGLSSPVATRRSSPGGGQTNTATEWTPGEALTNLRAASGVIWAPKHCASQDACCGTYVAAAAAAQLDTMSTATSTPRQALPTIAEDLAASQRVRPYPSTCTSTKLSHVDRRPVQLQPPIMPNPTPLGFKPLAPVVSTDQPRVFTLAFSSHVERLQVCKALAADPATNPSCPGECRVGCCLPHLLSVGINAPHTSPGGCSTTTAPARLAPVTVTLGLHEECRPSCLTQCGFARPTDLRWDILRSMNASDDSGSSSGSGGESDSTTGIVEAMSNVVTTSLPATVPPPPEQLLGQPDPSCVIPGYTHLPEVLPVVAGGPLGVNLIGNYTSSRQDLADMCSGNPRCVFFTTTGRAVGLFQLLLGGFTPADAVSQRLGMPTVGWSPDSSSSTPLVLPATSTTAVQLRLRYRRMPLCDSQCCGTFVADGALKWQRVVAPPDLPFVTALSTPPFPADVGGSWLLNVTARQGHCNALLQPSARLRFPFCTPACKAACCAPDLPLVAPECTKQLLYTQGCLQVQQEAYEQCAEHCQLPCGLHQTGRCAAQTACPNIAPAAARGVWRLTKGPRGAPVRAKRSYLD